MLIGDNQVAPRIKGLNVFNSHDEETLIYTNLQMMQDGVYIEDIEVEVEGDFMTGIVVKHFNSSDVFYWQLYDGVMLETIQKYRIIRDVYELYQELPIEEFLTTIGQMSGTSYSAGMQSDEERRMEIYNEMKRDFEEVQKMMDNK